MEEYKSLNKLRKADCPPQIKKLWQSYFEAENIGFWEGKEYMIPARFFSIIKESDRPIIENGELKGIKYPTKEIKQTVCKANNIMRRARAAV